MSRPYLTVESVHKYFGGVRALHDVSFTIDRGQIMGLIGPNGSGKSTMINVIAGALPPTAGEIYLENRSLRGISISHRVALGLGRTFQTTKVFPDFTVGEQLLAACHTRFRRGPIGSVLRLKLNRHEEKSFERRVLDLLEFVGLDGTYHTMVSGISSARQRLLMIATALAGDPGVILLDEPAAGMVAVERRELVELIKRIKDRGIGVLLVEHHIGMVMEVCERISVLNFGAKIAEDRPDAIANNQQVIDAYLGQTE
jgi:ABC-type branched-subunit amino acid transport system ATPase component